MKNNKKTYYRLYWSVYTDEYDPCRTLISSVQRIAYNNKEYREILTEFKNEKNTGKVSSDDLHIEKITCEEVKRKDVKFKNGKKTSNN